MGAVSLPPCGCTKRLHRMLPKVGFVKLDEGCWERRTKRGTVMIDLKPLHHFRASLLSLIAWVVL